MLSKMSHQQFDEWCAKDQIEPIGSMQPVCEILAKIGQIISAFMGHEMKAEYFMPWTKQVTQPNAKLTPKASIAAISSHLKILAGAK